MEKLPNISEMVDLNGKRALVTGGGKGIGAAISSRLVEAGAEVTQTSLIATGLINKLGYQIKVLAQGDIEIALNLKVHAISAAAKEKIEKAGGTVELIK